MPFSFSFLRNFYIGYYEKNKSCYLGPNGRSDMRNRLSAIRYKEGSSRHRGIHFLFFLAHFAMLRNGSGPLLFGPA